MMAWSVFNYLTQKLPRKAKVALGCTQYIQKVAENAISCSKNAEHNLFTPDLHLVAPPPPPLPPPPPYWPGTLQHVGAGLCESDPAKLIRDDSSSEN